MPTRASFSESAEIPASAARVYGIIADYRSGHPRIIPQRWFGPITVEQGGVGAGTVISFEFRAAGQTRRMRATISEPEPGRHLVETYEDGSATAFTVDPLGSDRCRVEIRTTFTPRGLRGMIERALMPRILGPVYRAELQQLRDVATSER